MNRNMFRRGRENILQPSIDDGVFDRCPEQVQHGGRRMTSALVHHAFLKMLREKVACDPSAIDTQSLHLEKFRMSFRLQGNGTIIEKCIQDALAFTH